MEEDLDLEEDQVLVVLVEIQEDLEPVDSEETAEDQEQAVAQDLEAMVEILEDQDLVVTLGCQVTVDLVVETAWEDLVWEILTMMHDEEKK